MNLVLQKPGSFNCGQCCVAMVAGIDRKASCKVFGTKRVTTTKSVSRARMKPARKESALPATCLLTLRFQKDFQYHGHWVVYYNGLIYCPSRGISSYAELVTRAEIKSISYLGFTKQ